MAQDPLAEQHWSIGLGATAVRWDDDGWLVMADPEDDEFCRMDQGIAAGTRCVASGRRTSGEERSHVGAPSPVPRPARGRVAWCQRRVSVAVLSDMEAPDLEGGRR